MIHIEACALYFAWATSCWHGQCCFTGSDFPRGVFYYVLLRRLTTWRDEELPTLASPCKGRGERVASEAGPDNDTLLTPARVRQQVSHALSCIQRCRGDSRDTNGRYHSRGSETGRRW